MKKRMRNWNYGKHACLFGGLYLAALAAGNFMLGTHKALNRESCREIAASRCPVKCIGLLSKKQKMFNGVLSACFLFDMTATYGLIKMVQGRAAKKSVL